MTSTVLMVCSANICRSPLAAYCAQRLLGEAVSVGSAGVDASDGSPMCGEAAQFIAHLPHAEAFAQQHRARGLTPDLVMGADLILCATAEQKDRVGRLDHSARVRTFTLLEASRIVDVLGVERAAPLRIDPEGLRGDVANPVAAFAALLHEARWRAASLPDVEPSMWPRRRRRGGDDPALSVADWHQRLTRSHTRMLTQTRRAAEGAVLPLSVRVT